MLVIAIILLAISVVLGLVIGVRYLAATQFMPYQAAVLGKSWTELEPRLQAVILAMLRVVGGGFIGLALTIAWLCFALYHGARWAPRAILTIAAVMLAPALYSTLALRQVRAEGEDAACADRARHRAHCRRVGRGVAGLSRRPPLVLEHDPEKWNSGFRKRSCSIVKSSLHPRSPLFMPDALELLKTRRSFKAVELLGPGPSAAEIDTLLTVASRVPDHGKLAPWRFIVFEGEARPAAGDAIAAAFAAKYPDAKPEQVEAERGRLSRAPLVIAVVSRAAPHVEDSRMGAGAVGRRRGHEPRRRGARARLRRQLDHGMVRLRPRRARCARPFAARAHRRLYSHRPAARPARRSPAAAARRDRDPLSASRSVALRTTSL